MAALDGGFFLRVYFSIFFQCWIFRLLSCSLLLLLNSFWEGKGVVRVVGVVETSLKKKWEL